MVAWDKSMVAAFNVILYSICWGIIGTLLIVIGLSMVGSQIVNIPGAFIKGNEPDFAKILIGLIVTVIGYIIVICGFLASFMKFLTELIVEEFDES